MKAEDTVDKYLEEMGWVLSKYGMQYALLVQLSEISFKAGIREVVEHVHECEKREPAFHSHIQVEKCYWQSQLKEWGVTDVQT